MAKAAIIFTDTPDGGFDFDFVMLDGEYDQYAVSVKQAQLAGVLFTEFMRSSGAVITEERGILAPH